MAGYIGNIPTPQATQSRQSFTATASQTTFATVGYTAGFLDVYLNGVHLLDGTDYTATNGSDIVLTTGAALNDVVEFVAYETFSVLDQSFTGTTTVDVLSVTGAATGTDLTLSGGLYVGGAVAANYLDDYEEGTWTPSFSTGVAGGATYSSQEGRYTKVGDTVFVHFFLQGAWTSTGVRLAISGLPFAKSSPFVSGWVADGWVSGNALAITIQKGVPVMPTASTYFYCSSVGSNSYAALNNSTTDYVEGSFSYFTSA